MEEEPEVTPPERVIVFIGEVATEVTIHEYYLYYNN